MTTIKIDAAVLSTEQQALADYYQNRNLLLAQAVADLKAMLAERDAEILRLLSPKTSEEIDQ